MQVCRLRNVVLALHPAPGAFRAHVCPTDSLVERELLPQGVTVGEYADLGDGEGRGGTVKAAP